MKLVNARNNTIAALISAAKLSGISDEMVYELKAMARSEVSPKELLGVTWNDLLEGRYWEAPKHLQVELFNRMI